MNRSLVQVLDVERGITLVGRVAVAHPPAIGRELYVVAGVGAVLVFVVLEARPFTRRVDEAVRRRTRELSEELERAIVSSDMDDRERRDSDDD